MIFKIISVGNFPKVSPERDIFLRYKNRSRFKIELLELDSKTKASNSEIIKKSQAKKILSYIKNKDYVVALDQKGKIITSIEFANIINTVLIDSYDRILFLIGGAFGLANCIINRANLVINFGNVTWPHLLVRAMLMEQIFRAESIAKNHPYHK